MACSSRLVIAEIYDHFVSLGCVDPGRLLGDEPSGVMRFAGLMGTIPDCSSWHFSIYGYVAGRLR